jgi:hypothetical protein
MDAFRSSLVWTSSTRLIYRLLEIFLFDLLLSLLLLVSFVFHLSLLTPISVRWDRIDFLSTVTASHQGYVDVLKSNFDKNEITEAYSVIDNFVSDDCIVIVY